VPPGLTFTSSYAGATLSGTPSAAGNYSFTVQVSDTAGHSTSKSFGITAVTAGSGGTNPGPPGIQVSQANLDFQGPAGGNTPPPQYISIVATNQQPLNATIQLDSGSDGTPAPPWLKARFVSATTPARLAVQTNQTGLPAGPYKGRVVVRYQNQQTVIVNVTFTIDLTPPQLSASPGFLRFVAISGATTAPQQALLVTNLGTGGPINFTSTVVGSGSPWLSVTPGTGVTALSASVPLQVTVNPAGLKIGSYLGKIRV
jgi:hypothetical protein